MTTDFLRKNIHVTFYSITEEGLRIDYTFEGKEYHLLAEPFQATTLLVDSGFLDGRDYDEKFPNMTLVLKYNNDTMAWEYFSKHHSKEFSQYFAIQCAILHEERKFLKGVYNQYLATGN
jgi:hypothetical protein